MDKCNIYKNDKKYVIYSILFLTILLFYVSYNSNMSKLPIMVLFLCLLYYYVKLSYKIYFFCICICELQKLLEFKRLNYLKMCVLAIIIFITTLKVVFTINNFNYKINIYKNQFYALGNKENIFNDKYLFKYTIFDIILELVLIVIIILDIVNTRNFSNIKYNEENLKLANQNNHNNFKKLYYKNFNINNIYKVKFISCFILIFLLITSIFLNIALINLNHILFYFIVVLTFFSKNNYFYCVCKIYSLIISLNLLIYYAYKFLPLDNIYYNITLIKMHNSIININLLIFLDLTIFVTSIVIQCCFINKEELNLLYLHNNKHICLADKSNLNNKINHKDNFILNKIFDNKNNSQFYQLYMIYQLKLFKKLISPNLRVVYCLIFDFLSCIWIIYNPSIIMQLIFIILFVTKNYYINNLFKQKMHLNTKCNNLCNCYNNTNFYNFSCKFNHIFLVLLIFILNITFQFIIFISNNTTKSKNLYMYNILAFICTLNNGGSIYNNNNQEIFYIYKDENYYINKKSIIIFKNFLFITLLFSINYLNKLTNLSIEFSDSKHSLLNMYCFKKVNKSLNLESTLIDKIINKSYIFNLLLVFIVSIYKSDIIHLIYMIFFVLLLYTNKNNFINLWNRILVFNKFIIVFVFYSWRIYNENLYEITDKKKGNLISYINENNQLKILFECLGINTYLNKNNSFINDNLEFILLYIYGYLQNVAIKVMFNKSLIAYNTYHYLKKTFRSKSYDNISLKSSLFNTNINKLKCNSFNRKSSFNNYTKFVFSNKINLLNFNIYQVFNEHINNSANKIFSIYFFFYPFLCIIIITNIILIISIKPISIQGILYIFLFVYLILLMISNNDCTFLYSNTNKLYFYNNKRKQYKILCNLLIIITLTTCIFKYIFQSNVFKYFIHEYMHIYANRITANSYSNMYLENNFTYKNNNFNNTKFLNLSNIENKLKKIVINKFYNELSLDLDSLNSYYYIYEFLNIDSKKYMLKMLLSVTLIILLNFMKCYTLNYCKYINKKYNIHRNDIIKTKKKYSSLSNLILNFLNPYSYKFSSYIIKNSSDRFCSKLLKFVIFLWIMIYNIALYLKVIILQLIYLYSKHIMILITTYITLNLKNILGLFIFILNTFLYCLEIQSIFYKKHFREMLILSISTFSTCLIYLFNTNLLLGLSIKYLYWIGISNSTNNLLNNIFPFVIINIVCILSIVSHNFNKYYMSDSIENIHEKLYLHRIIQNNEYSYNYALKQNYIILKLTIITMNVISFFYFYIYYIVMLFLIILSFNKYDIASIIIISILLKESLNSLTIINTTSYNNLSILMFKFNKSKFVSRNDLSVESSTYFINSKKRFKLYASIFLIISTTQYIMYIFTPILTKYNLFNYISIFDYVCTKQGKLLYSNNDTYKIASDYEYCINDWKMWLNIENDNNTKSCYNILYFYIFLLLNSFITKLCNVKDYEGIDNDDYTKNNYNFKLNSIDNYYQRIYVENSFELKDNYAKKIVINNKKIYKYFCKTYPFILRHKFIYNVIDDFSLFNNKEIITNYFRKFTNDQFFSNKKYSIHLYIESILLKNKAKYFLFFNFEYIVLFYFIIIILNSFTTYFLNLIEGGFLLLFFYLLYIKFNIKVKNNFQWILAFYYTVFVIFMITIFQTPLFPCPVNTVKDRSYISNSECYDIQISTMYNYNYNSNNTLISNIYSDTESDFDVSPNDILQNKINDNYVSYKNLYSDKPLEAIYILITKILGLYKYNSSTIFINNYQYIILLFLIIIQLILVQHPYMQYVREYYIREIYINSKARAFKFIQEIHLIRHMKFRKINNIIQVMKNKLKHLDYLLNKFSKIWLETYYNKNCSTKNLINYKDIIEEDKELLLEINDKFNSNTNNIYLSENISINISKIKYIINIIENSIKDSNTVIKKIIKTIYKNNKLITKIKFIEEGFKKIDDLIMNSSNKSSSIAGAINYNEFKNRLNIKASNIYDEFLAFLILEYYNSKVNINKYNNCSQILYYEIKNDKDNNSFNSSGNSNIKINSQISKNKCCNINNSNSYYKLKFNEFLITKNIKDNNKRLENYFLKVFNSDLIYVKNKTMCQDILNLYKHNNYGLDIAYNLYKKLYDNHCNYLSNYLKDNNNIVLTKLFYDKKYVKSYKLKDNYNYSENKQFYDYKYYNYKIKNLNNNNNNNIKIYRNNNKLNKNSICKKMFYNFLRKLINIIAWINNILKYYLFKSIDKCLFINLIDTNQILHINNFNLNIIHHNKSLEESFKFNKSNFKKNLNGIKDNNSHINNVNMLYNSYSLTKIFYYFFLSNVKHIILIVFILNAIYESSVLSLVYIIIHLGYGLIEYPIVNKLYWKLLMIYSFIIIAVKLLFQLPLFCGFPVYAVFVLFDSNHCQSYSITPQELTESFAYILGIRKYNGTYSYPNNIGLYNGLFYNLIIATLILFHIYYLKLIGIWYYVVVNNTFDKNPKFNCDIINKYKTKYTKNINSSKANNKNILYAVKRKSFCQTFRTKKIKNNIYVSKSWSKINFYKYKNKLQSVNLSNLGLNDSSILLKHETITKKAKSLLLNNLNIKKIKNNYFNDNFNLCTFGNINKNYNRNYKDIKLSKSFYCNEFKHLNLIYQLNVNDYSESNLKNELITNKKSNEENKSIFHNFLTRLFPDIYYDDNSIGLKPGRDYYPQSFASLMTILIYSLFYFSSMTGKLGQSLLDSLDRQQFSKDLVWTIILIVGIIVLDRIIYKLRITNASFINKYSAIKHSNNEYINKEINDKKLLYISNIENSIKSNKALIFKVFLHYILIFWIHYIVFILIPLNNHISVFNNIYLKIFYILCSIYLYFSACQIKHGYPLITKGQSFISSTNISNKFAFKFLRNIPFLFELRAILDWTITKTSLDLFQWFKLEDAYSNLYENQCEMDIRKEKRFGEAQILSQKIMWGLFSYISLIIIIIFPMILFSGFNPNLIENPTKKGKIAFNLQIKAVDDDYIAYYINLLTIENLRINKLSKTKSNLKIQELNKEFIYLKNEIISQEEDIEERKFQKVKAVSYSQSNWSLSPPAIETLLKYLERKVDCFIDIQWEFYREYPSTNKIISNNKKIKLKYEQKRVLRNIIYTLKSKNSSNKTEGLIINKAFPSILRLTNNKQKVVKLDNKSKGKFDEFVNVQLELDNKNNTEFYWRIYQTNNINENIIDNKSKMLYLFYIILYIHKTTKKKFNFILLMMMLYHHFLDLIQMELYLFL